MQLADLLFERRLSAPQWLETMLGLPEWRRVLYALGAANGDSTLLKYTMQRVVEAGLHVGLLCGAAVGQRFDAEA